MESTETTADGRWISVISDEDGFVYTSYEAAAEDLFDDHEVQISIRRGSAADFGGDERLPWTHRTVDVAHRTECYLVDPDDEADGARYRFALAQAMAAGLNAAAEAVTAR